MTPSESSTVLGKLKGAWPRQPISADTVRTYTKALAPFGFEEIAHAIDRIIRTAKFFPAVAEILEAAAMAQLIAPSSSMAWGEVVSELRRVGHCAAPEFSCPTITEAVREIGGWSRLCASRDATADRSKFHDAYRQLIREAVHDFARRDLPALPPQTPRGKLKK